MYETKKPNVPLHIVHSCFANNFYAASQVRLDSRTILMAIRNKDACNPIVRSTVRSYINIAQRYYMICCLFEKLFIVSNIHRMDPVQLREVQQNSQQKLS